jgi:PKD repeat protein
LFAQAAINAKLTAALGAGRLVWELQGQASQVYEIQASTDLTNWTPFATNQASAKGRVTFADAQAGQFQKRFFRLAARGPGGAGSRSDRILVKPKPGVDLSALNLSLGVSVLNVFPAVGKLHVIKGAGDLTASTLVHLYEASGLVQYAEPDFYVQALNGRQDSVPAPNSPDDPYYIAGGLWNLKNTGQDGGTPGADIHAWEAWHTTTSASNVIVGVVDTGVRYTHQDLAANIWANLADGTYGTNTVAGNTDPDDDYGHGTHVSGVIGAAGNNGVGVVGVCWDVQIMALKFLDSSATGTISGAIACLDYARTHGASVINASWGWTDWNSQSLHDAIASLGEADIVFVAAAGNSAADNDTTPLYPASFRDLDNVIAVAATDNNDLLASYSDYGPASVDLGAPGTSVLSCDNASDEAYSSESGTSFACAHVSGAVALLRGYFPGENHKQIIQRLLQGTDPLPSLAGKTITGGRLDVAKALGAELIAGFTKQPSSGRARLAVQFTDTSAGNPSSWNWTFGDGLASTNQNPNHTYESAGSFTATLTVSNYTGQSNSASSTVSVTPGLIAGFTNQPSSGPAPLAVQFTDTSAGSPASWNWKFGDGSASAAQNPNHTYSAAGSFTATLTVSNYTGQSSSSSTISVTNAVETKVMAHFSANPTSGHAPLTVQFTDHSTGSVSAWNWNFDDGSTDSAPSPAHTYTRAGSFAVRLTVSNLAHQSSSTSLTVRVTPELIADLRAEPSSGPAPLVVRFIDTSAGGPTSWNWTFGNGSASTARDPSHTYSSTGSFTATLSVSNKTGQSISASSTIFVTNAAPTKVVAHFSANPTSGHAPLTVQFTDQSTGPVSAWNWNFGDGSTDAAQNPSHTYDRAGGFTARLTVTGSSGKSSSATRTIVVSKPL